MVYKALLWGLGGGYDTFLKTHGYEQVEVVGITDSNIKIKKIDNISYIEKDAINDIGFDYLIVTVKSDKIFKEIVKEALSLGINRERIIPVRVFNIPFFNFDNYIKIKESNVSILSDYCFAGFLYHRFGLKHTSPTINMKTDNANYLKFLSELEYYMNKPMMEVTNSSSISTDGEFPRGRVGDVEWTFNHDKEFETACERWNQGVERFNWNNFIVSFVAENDEAAIQFDSLPIEKKIGFYNKDLGLKSIIYVPQWNRPFVKQQYENIFHRFCNGIASFDNKVINWMEILMDGEIKPRIEY